MPRFFALSAALVALASLPGCEEPLACDTSATASALVHVVGPDGGPLAATVTAVDADGNEVDVMCADGDDAATCTSWVVGWEVEGEITISASASDGCNTGTGSVTVDVPLEESGCHVVTQEAELVVDAWTDLDCG